MPRTNIITVGCRVEGKFGELVDNPNQTPQANGKQKRRVRRHATGTVIEAAAQRKWKVRLDYNNQVETVAATAMRVIAFGVGLPPNEVS